MPATPAEEVTFLTVGELINVGVWYYYCYILLFTVKEERATAVHVWVGLLWLDH